MNSTPQEGLLGYTIGYGGRRPDDFLDLLQQHAIATIIDVRLRPERSHMGIYARAKTADKGIQGLLARRHIAYVSLIELGNVFMEHQDWPERYRRFFEPSGDLLLQPLEAIPPPWCLMCAEKDALACHRQYIAAHLVQRGVPVVHLV